MTFTDFLKENNLPSIGTIVITPASDKRKVVRYEFEDNCEYVVTVDPERIEPTHIYWTYDLISLCEWEGKRYDTMG